MAKRGKSHVVKNAKHKEFKKSLRTRRRPKDIDQIQDELRTYDPNAPLPVDLDLPGFGQFPCMPCARMFVSQQTLDDHLKSKLHKKRLKLLAEPQYTQREAEAAAGMAPPLN